MRPHEEQLALDEARAFRAAQREQFRATVRKLHAEGRTSVEIARRLGRDNTAVSETIKSFGLEVNRVVRMSPAPRKEAR